MSQIICKLEDYKTIEIELLKNSFINEFVGQFKKVNQFCKFDQMFFNPCFYRKSWNQQEITRNEEILKECINNLNRLNTNFPIKEEEIKITNEFIGRDLLNRLHRHFTTGHRTACENQNFTWLENSNLTFDLHIEDYNEFAKLVHIINDTVHASELYFVNDRKINFPMTKEYLVLYNSQTYTGPEPNFSYFYTIKPEHLQYFSDDMSFDVWLPLSQIQGKNYLQGYVDEDDPTHWDISSNIFYSGSFSIGDRSWYNTNEIQNYLKSYNIEIGPSTCGMPLGKITKGKELLDNILKNKIIEITFNE